MIACFRNSRGFAAGFLAIIMAVVIIYILWNIMSKESSSGKTQKSLYRQQGIDTTNYKTTIESTTKKFKEINDQRMGQIDGVRKNLE